MKAGTTIRDIADLAGVSVSTVSLAFSTPERVAEKTRERILGVAKKLGYTPNLSASILRSGAPRANSLTRKLSLGFLHATTGKSPVLYEKEARRRSSELGYGFESLNLCGMPTKTHLRRELYSRGVAGVILGPALDPGQLVGLDLSSFSVVRCGRYEIPFRAHLVRPAVVQAVTTAWRELLQRGYRRIGAAFIRHSPEVPDDFTREMAVLGCQMRYHKKSERVPILWTALHETFDVVEGWYEKHRPDAILHFASPSAEWAYQSGLRIPEELGLLGLINPWHDRECAMVEDSGEIARAAVELCDQLVRHRQVAEPDVVREIVIPSIWRDGSSLRARE